MGVALAKNWWSLVIRGLAGVAFGIVTFLWPGITLAALVLLFAAYALITGVMSIVGGVRAAERHERWAPLVLMGVVGILACAVAVFWPAVTVLSLVFVIGAWAIFTGVLEIAAAIRLRDYISGEWLLALGGIASIVFGILILAMPIAGALVMALWIGAFAFLFGILEIVLGIRLRGFRDRTWSGPVIPAPAH